MKKGAAESPLLLKLDIRKYNSKKYREAVRLS